MSQTPEDEAGPSEDYKLGWLAINKMVNQGFSWSGHERNCVFLNTRGGAFADISSVTGLDFDDDGRSIATVDWDLDGDLDLFITNRTGPRLRFLRNGLEDAGGFLQLQLEGVGANRNAIGARVKVLLEGGSAPSLHRTRRAGSGYQAQSSAWMHFGLGEASVRSVEVRWPDGRVETFPGIQASGRYLLKQGTGQATPWIRPTAPQALAPSDPEPPRARSASRVVLATPVPMPALSVTSRDGRAGSLFGVESRARQAGRPQAPVLVQLWATWCAPCVAELGAFTDAAADLKATGLEVLALNIEPRADHGKANDLLQKIGWPHPTGFASTEALEILDALQGSILRQDIRIPVPSSFLVDGQGNLIAFYLGRVEPSQVLEDLSLLPLDAAARLQAALPFEGRWLGDPPAQSPAFLERAFLDRGLPMTAREYQPGWIHLQFGRSFADRKQLPQAEAHFRAALEAGPYFAEAFAGLAHTLHRQGKAAEAIDAYGRALALDPDNPTTHFNLGLAHLARKDHAAVRRQVRRLRELDAALAAKLEGYLGSESDG